jgi:hypothetical protein
VTLCLQVQAALHANQTRKLPWRWSDCTRMISYSHDDLLSSMLPTYKNLLKTGARDLVAAVGCSLWCADGVWLHSCLLPTP